MRLQPRERPAGGSPLRSASSGCLWKNSGWKPAPSLPRSDPSIGAQASSGLACGPHVDSHIKRSRCIRVSETVSTIAPKCHSARTAYPSLCPSLAPRLEHPVCLPWMGTPSCARATAPGAPGSQLSPWLCLPSWCWARFWAQHRDDKGVGTSYLTGGREGFLLKWKRHTFPPNCPGNTGFQRVQGRVSGKWQLRVRLRASLGVFLAERPQDRLVLF